ncbi:Rhs family protein, partial [hydrothermal vent metagenome]
NVSYQYNALGQRAAKDVSGSVTSFAYGLGGELLGEYEAGVVQAEHIYLGGQPLAVIQDGNVYYIHSDHLGTPRVISDQNQTAVWQWESDPFGATAANDDVDTTLVRPE